MAKTKQIASIQYPGYRIVIIRHNEKRNPYHIVKKWGGYNEKNYWAEHSKTLETYADLYSCLHYLLTLPNME